MSWNIWQRKSGAVDRVILVHGARGRWWWTARDAYNRSLAQSVAPGAATEEAARENIMQLFGRVPVTVDNAPRRKATRKKDVEGG